MANNSSLHAAGLAKQDEFYTRYEDIQSELNHYEKHFRGKTVFCNCDDPFESNFCKFFLRNFNYLGLKRLICTSYSSSPIAGQQLTLFDFMDEPVAQGSGYVIDISEIPMANGRGVSDSDIDALLKSKKRGVKKLKGDGDFRSEECIEYLKQADIVVTNPPFSLFREYVSQLMAYQKDFLIIGNQNAITYKEIFPLIQENKIWLGWKFGDMAFRVPNYYEPRQTRFWVDETGQKWRSLGTICWYTNLDHDKRHKELVLYKRYYGNEDAYPKYDNYDAINVDRVSEIPCDYFEDMGVPITYLDKHNPDQFEIIGSSRQLGRPMSEIAPKGSYESGGPRFYLPLDKSEIARNNFNGTERNGTERNGTERNGTERNGTERNGTERNGTEQTISPPVRQNRHQAQDVTESWGYQSLSLTSIAQINSRLSEQQRARERDSQAGCGMQTAELHSRLSVEREDTNGYSSRGRSSGIMGVPITFLDKYSPDQFEIVGLAAGNIRGLAGIISTTGKDGPYIGGKLRYGRIFIKRKK